MKKPKVSDDRSSSTPLSIHYPTYRSLLQLYDNFYQALKGILPQDHETLNLYLIRTFKYFIHLKFILALEYVTSTTFILFKKRNGFSHRDVLTRLLSLFHVQSQCYHIHIPYSQSSPLSLCAIALLCSTTPCSLDICTRITVS